MIIYRHRNKPENIIFDSIDVKDIIKEITHLYALSNPMFIQFGDLSLTALNIFIINNINKSFNDNKLIKECTKALNEVLKVNYQCKPSSKFLNYGYYIECGHSEEEAKIIVSNIQKSRSNRCVEYWINKGFTNEEALIKVNQVQKQYAEKSAEKLSLDYWLKCGLSYDEAIIKQREYNLKIASSSKEHLKQINHKSDEEIEQIRKIRYNTRDPQICALRHNISIDDAKAIVKDRIARSTCCGTKNGMYGHKSPLRSGAAYSGYYKDFYFRSFSEYCFIKLHESEDIHSAEDKFKVVWKEGKTYRPDFIIGDTIYEIKCDYMLDNDETKLKLKALKEMYPEYKIILVPAKSIPKPPKEIVLNDIENGNLRIVKSKMEKFKQFMEKYK